MKSKRITSGSIFLSGLIIIFFGLSHCKSSSSINNITPQDEIAIGLTTTPKLIFEYGGLFQNDTVQQLIKQVGQRIAQYSKAKKSPYKYDFFVLADRTTLNAISLPGGQVFITYGLLAQLKTEKQLAAILSHEIAHVVSRHSIKRLDDPGDIRNFAFSGANDKTGKTDKIITQLMNVQYERDQEMEADDQGVRYLIESGYDATGMSEVMSLLNIDKPGKKPSGYISMHPGYDNRIKQIEGSITKYKDLEGKKGDKELPEEK